MTDKIIQISQDAEGNLMGLGESGTTYYEHLYKSGETKKHIWVEYINSKDIYQSKDSNL